MIQEWFKLVMPSLSKLRKVPDRDCQFCKSTETRTDGPIGPVQVQSGPWFFSSPKDQTFNISSSHNPRGKGDDDEHAPCRE